MACHIWTGPTATINYSSLPLFLPLFITAAFYFTPSSAASVIEQTPSSSACGDLECWLGSLVINIPDQRFEVLDVSGTLTNAQCSNITLGHLASGVVPPAGIELAATGLSIECTMDWGLKAFVIQAHGSAMAQVSDSSLTLGLQLQSDRPVNATAFKLPVSASLALCTPRIDVAAIIFQGDLGNFLNLFSTQIASILSTQLDKIICDQLSTLVQTNLTDSLQEVNQFIAPYLKPRPVVPAPTPPAGMIDLRSSPLVGVTAYLLNDVVGADGPLGLNKIVNALTNGTGSVTLGPLANVSLPIAVSSLGVVRLGLETVTLSGLNSWSLFQALDPSTGPYNLTSHTRLERLGLSFGFSLNVSLAGAEAGSYLYEKAELEALMTDNALDSVLQLAIGAAAVERLSNEQAIVPGCLLSTVHDVNMTQLDLSFVLAQLQIVARGANHSGNSNYTTEQQIDAAVNHAFTLLTGAYAEVLPALFNGLVAGPVRELINVGVRDEVLQANGTCANPSGRELVNQETTTAAFSTAAGMYVTLLLIVGLAEYLRWRERSADIVSPSDNEDGDDDSDDEEAKLLTDVERKARDGKAQQQQNKWQRSLLFSPRLPCVARHSVLVVLLINIALFVSATTSIGASVSVYVTLGDHVTRLPSLFDFTLAHSVTEMWKAEVYMLAVLILVFSGLWPYAKLVLVLGCWIAPRHLLPHRRREQMMMALDALGKWSLIDAFVLTLTMVAFNFHIVPPVSPHTPPGTASVDAYLVPHWGFYGFMLATMLSLGVTHVVLACHRYESRCAAAAAASADVSTGGGSGSAQAPEWKALCTHAFRATAGPVWSRLIAVALTGLLVLAIGLIGSGAAYPSFEFEFRGAFKLLLDFLHDPNVRPYSIISTGLAIPEGSPDPDTPGVRFIQATWFCFAIVVPLCHQLLLLLLWLTPLTPRLQRAVFVVTEVVNAWSALDVVVVSVIVALLELQQFSQFIIGDRCALINSVLAKYFGPVLDGDTRCFDVVTTLDEGCWLLFTACVINIVVGLLVQLTCHKVLRQREEEQLAAAQQQQLQPAGTTQPEDKPLQVQRIFTINRNTNDDDGDEPCFLRSN